MPEVSSADVKPLFDAVGASANVDVAGGLVVTAPATGDAIASIVADDALSVGVAVVAAQKAQAAWAGAPREAREAFLLHLSQVLASHQETLARLITLEGGKPKKDALGEAGRASGVLAQTVKDAAPGEVNSAQYREVRRPVGVVGLITSYNFPVAVANWTIAPALLAGNAVVWKPSEKTPLTAIAYKALFDRAVAEFNESRGASTAHTDLVRLVIGERTVGQALVEHEGVAMVSATGSVGMGKALQKVLAQKKGNKVPPILELGGNNAVVVTDRCAGDDLKFAVGALMQSTVFGGGQLCTCTRRIIVHEKVWGPFIQEFRTLLAAFVESGGVRNPLTADPATDTYCFAPLIDRAAYLRVERALTLAKSDGGTVLFGGDRALEDVYPDAYYVTPALVEMPVQTPTMYEETFGPVVYLLCYAGDVDSAMELANAPGNAGLVNGMYTASKAEAERFAELNEGGHGVINAAVGTRAPMMWANSFGGNKDSGVGRILDRVDPLAAFTLPDGVCRVAVHPSGISMS